MEIKQTKSEKNVATVNVVMDKKEVDAHRDHVVDEMITQVTVKGFRQGKAPRNVAINHLDENKLTDRLFTHILNDAVTETMSKFSYRLLGRPVLENIDTKDEKGWNFTINFPLYPEFKLGDYKKLFSKKAATKKTSTKKTESDSAKNSEDEKLNNIYDTLLKNIEVDIAPSVIDEEINYSLNRLVSQAKSLNLSFEDYLKAVNKTIEQVREEYKKSASESLRLDLILLAIAKEENINSTEEEVKKMAEVSQIPESQYGQIKAILDRRKTIEFLSKL